MAEEETTLPNRQLSKDELDMLFSPLITEVRKRLVEQSGGNEDLLWLFGESCPKSLVTMSVVNHCSVESSKIKNALSRITNVQYVEYPFQLSTSFLIALKP